MRQRTMPFMKLAKDDESDTLLQAETRVETPSNDEDDDLRYASDEIAPQPSLAPVLLLALVFTANQWARQLPFYTVDFKAGPGADAVREFMNVDIGFGEAEYGVLASIGFAALFSITSLLAGGLVDRVDSRNLLTTTAAVWSGATLWQAAASSFNEILASRMLSGVGQAFSNPASYTILARIYPAERRATVNGIYSSGLYFGGGLAALSVLLDQALGWRGAFTVVGVLGLASAAIAQLALPPLPPEARTEPIDCVEDIDAKATQASKATGANEGALVLAQLLELVSEPTVALLLLASALRFLAGFTIGVWIVPFYREAFSGSIGAEFALIKAAVNGVAGSLSATGGGLLADRLSKRDPRFNQWIPALGSVVAIPFWLLTLQAPTLELSLGALFLEYLFAECWFGPTIAGLQAAAPPSAQGLTTGVFSCLTFVGNLGASPFCCKRPSCSATCATVALLTPHFPCPACRVYLQRRLPSGWP